MNKTKVFAVRVRDKYDQRVEDYINSKISNVTFCPGCGRGRKGVCCIASPS